LETAQAQAMQEYPHFYATDAMLTAAGASAGALADDGAVLLCEQSGRARDSTVAGLMDAGLTYAI